MGGLKSHMKILFGLAVELAPCLIKHHVMQKFEGMKVQLHSFLTPSRGGGEWSGPAALPLGRRHSGTHSTRSWVGFAGQTAVVCKIINKINK